MKQITCPSCGVSSQQIGRFCPHCAQPLQPAQPLGQPPQAYAPQPQTQQPHFNQTQVYRDERTRIAARNHPTIILLLILVGVIIVGVFLTEADRRGDTNGQSPLASSNRGEVKARLELDSFTWQLISTVENPRLECQVTVRNNTADQTITGITWLLEFYNKADGRKVEELTLRTSKGFDEYLKILPGEAKSLSFTLGDEFHEGSYLQAHRIVLASAGKVLSATAKISTYKSSAFDPAVDKQTPDKVSLYAE